MNVFRKVSRKMENALQINLKYYIKNFSYMYLNNVVTIIFSLALSVMLARVLSSEIFGQYNFILSVLGIVSLLTLPGMNSSLMRSSARGFDGSFIEGTGARIRWGVLGSLVLFIIALYYLVEGSFLLSYVFMITALLFISYYSFRTYQGFLVSKKRFKRFSAYVSVTTIVANFTTMIVAYYSRNLLIIVFVLLGLVSIMNSIFLYRTIKERKNNKIDKGMIPYGKHITFVQLIPIIRSHFDKIIVAFFLGFEALAIYSVAIIIPRQMKPFWSILSDMIFPTLSRKNKKDAYSAVKKRFKYMLLLQAAIIIVAILILPPVILYFYSGKYAGSIFYGQLLMLFTISGPGVILVKLVTSQKQLKKVYKVSIIPSLISIILLTTLTYLFGLVGAIVAIIFGSGIIPLFLYWFIVFGNPNNRQSNK